MTDEQRLSLILLQEDLNWLQKNLDHYNAQYLLDEIRWNISRIANNELYSPCTSNSRKKLKELK